MLRTACIFVLMPLAFACGYASPTEDAPDDADAATDTTAEVRDVTPESDSAVDAGDAVAPDTAPPVDTAPPIDTAPPVDITTDAAPDPEPEVSGDTDDVADPTDALDAPDSDAGDTSDTSDAPDPPDTTDTSDAAEIADADTSTPACLAWSDPSDATPAQRRDEAFVLAGADLGLGGPLPDELVVTLGSATTGTFDLASGVNTNHGTCVQCVLVREDVADAGPARVYFQRAGALTVIGGDATPDDFTVAIADLELVEVTIDPDDHESHPVDDGACLTADLVTLESLCRPTALDDATCDGVDDDCSGADDEDFVSTTTHCGVGACAASGATSCAAGEVVDSCTPGSPSASDATCDDIDDDCADGTDEDFVPSPTTCGVGACAVTGSTSCSGGRVVDTCAAGTPAASDTTCDGVDDDCADGTDEDFVPTATTCGTGACAASGTTVCTDGRVVDTCSPGAPAASDATCDGVDDDCADGTDEDFVPTATTCGVGACAATGSTSCEAGATGDTCTPSAPAADDATCDGVDDDCADGTDEDYVPLTTQCGLGECAASGLTHCADAEVVDDCAPREPCYDGLLLPRDPASIAPPLDPSVSTSLADATAFLYTGDDPIQVGVAPGAIEPERAAVTSGRVLGADGAPHPGVTVTVLDHPELGMTRSRLDGAFDLAVNGGDPVVLTYDAQGYLPVQRRVDTTIRDFARADDVVMTPIDPVVTEIEPQATDVQVARGSPQTDADGTRQATLLIPSGTSAGMHTADGTSEPLATLGIRLTEFTVGDTGPAAMPGGLPASSAYTYAVELSVDEAMEAGATKVEFDRPLAFYVDNFLDFPVGTAVPVGYYDREIAAWVPSADGRIIKVLSVTQDRADLDVTGGGVAADTTQLAALGIDDAERERLASLYEPGKTLARVRVTHFTPFDCNWPYRIPSDAIPPALPETLAFDEVLECSEETSGSIIECQNQVLGERLPIVGSDMTLNYRSSRAPGFSSALDFPISAAELPTSLKRIEVDVHVAGRTTHASFAPAPDQRYRFAWDRRDAFGREVSSAQARVRVSYWYDAVYRSVAATSAQSFGLPSTSNATVERPSNGLLEARLYQNQTHTFSGIDVPSHGLGGWSLDVHHFYDVGAARLYLGDGSTRTENRLTASTVAGGHTDNAYGCAYSGPASLARITSVSDMARDSRGNLYFTDNGCVRKIDAEGNISRVAGCATPPCAEDITAEGKPATQFYVIESSLAVDSADRLYMGGRGFIWRIADDGTLERIAGGGTTCCNRPARDAQLSAYPVRDLAFDAEGNLYFTHKLDDTLDDIRKIDREGYITRWYAHFSNPNPSGLPRPTFIAHHPDGSVYFSTRSNGSIRRKAPDGTLSTALAAIGAGGPMAFDSRGDLVFVDGNFVRRLGADGMVVDLAGSGGTGAFVEGSVALDVPIRGAGGTTSAPYGVRGLVVHPQGFIVGYPKTYSTSVAGRIVSFEYLFPRFTSDHFTLPSADGSELYRFDKNGRHLATSDAVTGAVIRTFQYDGPHLSGVTDRHGNVTSITRHGDVVEIRPPFGPPTSMALDADGRMVALTNPADETSTFTYDAGGLLVATTDPRGHTTTFTYDGEGRLVRDEDPAGGFKQLARTGDNAAFAVTLETAEGRTTIYQVEHASEAAHGRVTIDPAGLRTTTAYDADASAGVTFPDGTHAESSSAPDPRFGLLAPTSATTTTTPSGLAQTQSVARTVALADRDDPMSFATWTETTTVNGRSTTRSYDAATRTEVFTSPAGRDVTLLRDALGRVIERRAEGLAPIRYGYDEAGRVTRVAHGDAPDVRAFDYTYGDEGMVASITDPLGRTLSVTRDAAARVISKSLPGGRTVAFGYDAAGNMTSVTPPGRPAHVFDFDPRNLEVGYEPPALGPEATRTTTTYDLDRQPTAITRPDGRGVTITYDSAGRLASITTAELGWVPDRTVTTTYAETTGQVTAETASDGPALAFTHDGPLQLSTTWSGPVAGTVSRTWDADWRVATESVGDHVVAYTYDGDGLTTAVGDMTIERDPATGLVLSTDLGLVHTTRSYNAFGELVGEVASFDGSELYAVSLVRDAIGRVTEKTETVLGATEVTAYGYDDAGRLTSVTRDGVVTSYVYDLNGNRLSRTDEDGVLEATYDAQDRLLAYGPIDFAHDAAGDQVAAVGPDGTTTTRYDAHGNLVRVDMADGARVDYVIDPQNRRVARAVDGVRTAGYLYRNALQLAAELAPDGQVRSRFVYATGAHTPDYLVRDGAAHRVIVDPLGSPILIVDALSGAIAQIRRYDAFGIVIADSAPGFQPIGFAGGLHDETTDLVRFGARDYDPTLGRWLVKDPIRFEGGDLNLYSYASNDPLNHVDISGLDFCDYVPDMFLNIAGTACAAMIAVGKGPALVPAVALGGAAGAVAIHCGNKSKEEALSSVEESTGGDRQQAYDDEFNCSVLQIRSACERVHAKPK